MPADSKSLIEKIGALSAERIFEIEDFADFIRLREQERALIRAAAAASGQTFAAICPFAPEYREYQRYQRTDQNMPNPKMPSTGSRPAWTRLPNRSQGLGAAAARGASLAQRA